MIRPGAPPLGSFCAPVPRERSRGQFSARCLSRCPRDRGRLRVGHHRSRLRPLQGSALASSAGVSRRGAGGSGALQASSTSARNGRQRRGMQYHSRCCVAGQRADQRDQADHDRRDAEAERALAIERRQVLAPAEDAEQPDRAAGQAEQAAGDAQRPLVAPPKHARSSHSLARSLACAARTVKRGGESGRRRGRACAAARTGSGPARQKKAFWKSRSSRISARHRRRDASGRRASG